MNESTYVMYLSDFSYPRFWGFWELFLFLQNLKKKISLFKKKVKKKFQKKFWKKNYEEKF